MEDNIDFDYHTIKCKLKNILKYPSMLKFFENRVDITNRIWTEASFLFNLYVMYLLENYIDLPFDNVTIDRCVLFVLGRSNTITGGKLTDNELQNTKNNLVSEIKEINMIINDIYDGLKEVTYVINDLRLSKSKLSDNICHVRVSNIFNNQKYLQYYNSNENSLINLTNRLNHINDDLSDLEPYSNLILDFIKHIGKTKVELERELNLLSEFMILKHVYSEIYNKLGHNNLEKYSSIPSIKKPFEFLSRQLMVNITNHTNLHFKKYQKRYLIAKYSGEINRLGISEKYKIYPIVACIQYHLNNKIDKLTILSKKILKLDNIDDVAKLMINIINDESKLIPNVIRGDITSANLKKNCMNVLKYYCTMIGYLEDNQTKRFSLLPQIHFGYTYVKFESRLLSVIHDEWINSLLLESEKSNVDTINKKYNIDFPLKTVGIKEFEKNCSKYFERCFNFKKFNLLPGTESVSFQTDGYSVSVLFRHKKNKPKKEGKEKRTKKIVLDEKINKKFKRGLFDADETEASPEFLDQFHKMAIDPNNDVMLYCISECGKKIEITKNYFNNISHITKNTRKKNKYIKDAGVKEIYNNLSNISYKKTVKIEKYKDFIKEFRKISDKIWNCYGENKFLSLSLDTYINRKKALNKIARRLVPKNTKNSIGVHRFDSYKSKYVDNDKYNKIKKLPVIIAFGKGNGNMTISNLRNKGPKGPIKEMAILLSKLCLVILTDEYNTSKLDSLSKNKEVIHPKVTVNKTKKIKDPKTDKISRRNTLVSQESHKLCYCENDTHKIDSVENSHKVWWNRDYNASRNILNVMMCKLTKKDLGKFKRTKSKKVNDNEGQSWSLKPESQPRQLDS